MQIGTPFPFPEARADEFLDGLDAVIVFEELDSVIEDGLVHVAGLRAARGKSAPRVLGRASGACRDAGENDADDIAERLSKFFDEALRVARVFQATSSCVKSKNAPTYELARAKPPYPSSISSFPHAHRCCAQAALIVVRFTHASKRSRKCAFAVSFRAISAVTPWATPSPLDAVDTCLCMGAGITMAQGLGVADPTAKQLAFVGDSTFFASGITGVANAVYNQHDITVCVLDNSTTAMTGGAAASWHGQHAHGTEKRAAFYRTRPRGA